MALQLVVNSWHVVVVNSSSVSLSTSQQTQPIQMLAGTYLGLVEKLDYLQTLGINAIELLPVQEFNELEYYQVQPLLLCLEQTSNCFWLFHCFLPAWGRLQNTPLLIPTFKSCIVHPA